ncbi:MAG TPA: DUF4129 domain-containing protein [Desulfobacteraceae bacterium]|nr:DUF4129 domain-containing protein [Desulfobacteraceae bacterium]HPJ67393.1 DUF4129 domain-containing protein [Desulfobacteraceae bacterium]HPQ28955.1 DUF4129 domain-containing protein [Desulfobacteraceae bacterium]
MYERTREMKAKEKALLWLARGGMELCWLYAWATFTINAILHRPFPLPEALGAFMVAVLFTLLVRRRGWRVIMNLGIQLLGFLFAISIIVYSFSDRLYPYFGREWIVDFLSRSRSPVEWIVLVITLLWAAIFWLSGILFTLRSADYNKVCHRFDLGVAAFFCLFLLKLLIKIKGGLNVPDTVSEFLIFPFFIFGLLAVGIANSRNSVQKDFISGFRGIGLSVGFSVIMLSFGLALVLFFLPYLTAAAEVGYTALKKAVGPLSPYVISVIRFIFTPRIMSRQRADQSSSDSSIDFGEFGGEQSWWSILIEKILGWSLFSVFGLLIIFAFCIGMWYLIRWLLSRSAPAQIKQGSQFSFHVFILRLKEALSVLWEWIYRGIRGYADVGQLFGAVMRWGRRSGMPKIISETPLEYGLRLKKCFPFLEGEIEVIVDAFNHEVYGGMSLTDEEFRSAKTAWTRLRSPRHWPSRFKSLFFADAKQGWTD